jgi:carboxylesterase
LRRFHAFDEAESAKAKLHDVCHSKLMTHGQLTEHVMVFLHGYTTCPEQFAELGRRFFELGYNVFIPCMPHHGCADRMTEDQRNLTAEELAAYGDEAVDIARGLGRQVTVMGISGGGTVVAWLAQNRADVDYAMPLSAFIGMGIVPDFLTKPLINLLLTLPNFFIWWDPRTKEDNPYSIYYAYPRFSTHSLGQTLRLGLAVKEQAKHAAPAACHILMITNAADPSVSNSQLDQLMGTWRQHGAADLHAYQFEKEMKMLHDIITPGTPGVPIEEVYPRLIEQVQKLHQIQSSSIEREK